jgi:hypothetical protein
MTSARGLVGVLDPLLSRDPWGCNIDQITGYVPDALEIAIPNRVGSAPRANLPHRSKRS